MWDEINLPLNPQFSYNFNTGNIICMFCGSAHNEKKVVAEKKFAHKPDCIFFKRLQRIFHEHCAIDMENKNES